MKRQAPPSLAVVRVAGAHRPRAVQRLGEQHAHEARAAASGPTGAASRRRCAFSAGSSPSGPPTSSATSRPSPLPRFEARGELRRRQRVAALVEHDAARALRQRGLDARRLGRHQLRRRVLPSRGSAFTAFSSSRSSGGKRLAKSSIRRLGPGRLALADRDEQQLHAAQRDAAASRAGAARSASCGARLAPWRVSLRVLRAAASPQAVFAAARRACAARGRLRRRGRFGAAAPCAVRRAPRSTPAPAPPPEQARVAVDLHAAPACRPRSPRGGSSRGSPAA